MLFEPYALHQKAPAVFSCRGFCVEGCGCSKVENSRNLAVTMTSAQARLAHAHWVEQGMMQELLKGTVGMNGNRAYYRIMLGAKSAYAEQCYAEKWFGGGWGISQNLTGEFTENWRDFNSKFIPVYLESHLGKSRVAAGLACGMLWTICKGIREDDVVLCPDGKGSYWAGRVLGDYFYVAGEPLPHRRRVEWYPGQFVRADMSQALQNSTGAIGTVSNITKHGEEIEGFLAGHAPPKLIATDELVEDPSVFALEKHLEEFLIQNWSAA